MYDKVKAVADSILISKFGKMFFENHIKFLLESSMLYGVAPGKAVKWYELPMNSLKEFSVRYSMFSGDSKDFDIISIDLNKDGRLTDSSDISGVFNIKNQLKDKSKFNYDYDDVLQIIRKRGIVNDTSFYHIRLFCKPDEEIYSAYSLKELDIPVHLKFKGRYVWEVAYYLDNRVFRRKFLSVDAVSGKIEESDEDFGYY